MGTRHGGCRRGRPFATDFGKLETALARRKFWSRAFLTELLPTNYDDFVGIMDSSGGEIRDWLGNVCELWKELAINRIGFMKREGC